MFRKYTKGRTIKRNTIKRNTIKRNTIKRRNIKNIKHVALTIKSINIMKNILVPQHQQSND